jgi:phosphate transport system substrate-binding protein
MVLAVVAAGCVRPKEAVEKEITINPGKQLSEGGLNHVIEAFEKKTGIKVNIPKVGGCGDSEKGLRAGTIDVGAFCCPLACWETGKEGFVDVAVARDAVEFIVAKDNPVDDLTLDQIQAIYQGRITNWKEVGGKDASIVPYAHIMCANREEVARKLMVGHWDLKAGKTVIDDSLFVAGLKDNDARDMKDELDMVKCILNDPSGIAHVSRSFNDKTAVKTLKINGILPTKETIMDSSYPGVRYLHIGTKGLPDGATKMFLDFLLSDEGQQLLMKEDKIFPRD